MKKIAISQRLIETSAYFEERETLDIRWGKLFEEIGMMPIVLPLNFDFHNYFEEIEIDGLILSGGNDLAGISQNELSKKRDSFESELLQYAIFKKMPVLGFCRGMQLIGNYFGESLKMVENHVGKRHNITVKTGAKYSKVLSGLTSVNSYHNYALDGISEQFNVLAIAADGEIEAIEHKTEKVVGVMWHSEREDPFNSIELEFIKKVFEK